MKKAARQTTGSLILFAISLIFISYLNHDSNVQKRFAWTTINYRSPSNTIPEARGICPGLQQDEKPALIVAKLESDDSNWLDSLSNTFNTCIYVVDKPIDTNTKYLQIPGNRGHEAMVYLTFITDNYHNFPKAGAVFVHGSRRAWHNDDIKFDNAAILQRLNISSALAPLGYHNLRCDWSASTCMPSETPQNSIETFSRSVLEPWNTRVLSDQALSRTLATIFGGESVDGNKFEKLELDRSDTVRAQCCGQFVVARENVWQHSKEEYIALRQWLLDVKTSPSDDRVAGRILSYLWHILFLHHQNTTIEGHVDLKTLNSLACPSASECYCRLYGLCSLQGCTDAHCRGQYHLPLNFKLPEE